MGAVQTEGKRKIISSGRMTWARGLRTFGTLIGFLIIVGVFWSQRPTTFMTVNNWLNITQQISILGVLAFTMTVVMVVGDFDLSVGAMASLIGIVIGKMFEAEQPIFVAVIAGLGVGILGGMFNGVLVSYIRISPFVATLSTMTIFSGLALFISGGSTIFGRIIPETFSAFGNDGIFIRQIDGRDVDFPFLTLVMLAALILIGFILERTVFGQHLYAIGGNPEASRLSGVRVRILRLIAFAVSGFGAAAAGIMLTSRLASANPKQGDGLMLSAIAAVFLGMTMSEEGEPHVLGTLLGVLILGVMANGLTQLNVDSYIQQILTGGIIIFAVAISSLSRRA